MPKRGGKAPQEDGGAAEPELEQAPADLDLSSDEGIYADGGVGSDTDSEGAGSLQSDEEELQDAIADYMQAAQAARPADAVGDDAEAGPSGEDHLE